ncbi:MAG: glycosyl transferase [Planctomycetes bacterium GWC2_49_10]|nr:MAG: glycosyl transferase [Planctomycetes bacterium GWC2_49_10]
MELSVVVPLLNEEDNIKPLYDEIIAAVNGRFEFEIIFVDDGSTDSSFDILKQIAGADKRVRVLKLRKNFGQTAAMSAGFDNAKGQIVVPLDADRQNDPADISALIQKLNEGYDIVSGWRKQRQDKALSRRMPSMLANKMIAWVTKVRLHDFGCTLKAYRREILEETRLYGEMHRFIPALASWRGAKVTEIVVNHRPRTAGVAKYGLGRTFKVLLDLITVKFLGSYSTKPIYVFGGTGVVMALMAFVSGLFVLYQKFISEGHLAMNRNPLLVLTALLITTSVQFILMGLLAEILVRTYHESQNRTTYVVKEKIN